MIIELTTSDFEAMLHGIAPGNLRLVRDSEIAPPDVLEMLSRLAADIGPEFSPSAWMIVEDGEIVGLCSIVRTPEGGKIHIGYGIAPSRQSRGYTTRAIGELLAWARNDLRVTLISAETALENIASQRVLERNGFTRAGERIDAEDGPLVCWEVATV